MVKLTPIEEAIAETVDRTRRYNKRRHKAGLIRRSYWIPQSETDLVHAITIQLSAEHTARADEGDGSADEAESLASKLRAFFDQARTSASHPAT